MMLTSRLKSILEARSVRSQAIYQDTIARVKTAEVAEHAVKVGQPAPPFLLPNAEGHLVASDELLAGGPLVVSFFRGGWCPYCAATMLAMQAALPAIQAAGAKFVAIWPETGGLALRAKLQHSLSYELLVDADNAVAMQFGIVFRLPDRYREALLDGGVDLSTRHGNGGWLLPVTATYVIASDGLIGYAFVDADFTTRAEPEDIVGFLKSLRP
jgi:peroxiredoxin